MEEEVAITKRSRLNLSTNNEKEEEDRLSSLPDCLLVEILLLLPFNSAAATSVLSRRWQHLWTHHTHLLLDFQLTKSRFRDFAASVDRILRQLASPKLRTFTLYLNNYFLIADEFDYLLSWVSRVCARNPDSIGLISSWNCGMPPFVTLPGCVLNCESLVALSLRGKAQIGPPPRDGILISLPNLKKLEMSVSDHGFEFAGKLIKSCPLLEHLYLRLCHRGKDDHFLDVVALNLKYLHTHVDEACLKVVINAPRLEHLTVEGNFALYSFVNTPAALLTAQISFDETAMSIPAGLGFVNYFSRISSLVQGISCAKTVVLSRFTVDLLSFYPCGANSAMPVFRNLSNLLLKIDTRMCSFGRCPIPACFLRTVKRIKISAAIEKDDCYLRLLEHILRYAMVLKQLVVFFSRYDVPGSTLRRLCEDTFCKKLFMLPRSSSGCQIHFLGSCVTATSDGLKIGSPAYQIDTLN